jgi:hypothetical protein
MTPMEKNVFSPSEHKINASKSDNLVVFLRSGYFGRAAVSQRQYQQPRGLANSSDQVVRNYMYHLLSIMIALSKKPNPKITGVTI